MVASRRSALPEGPPLANAFTDGATPCCCAFQSIGTIEGVPYTALRTTDSRMDLLRLAPDAGTLALQMLGLVAAVANGMVAPLMNLELSRIAAFATRFESQRKLGTEPTPSALWDSLSEHLWTLGSLATLAMVAAFGQTAAFQVSAARVGYRVRRKAFSRLLRKDLAFFELSCSAPEAAARLEADCDSVQGALANLGLLVQHAASTVVCLFLAFNYGQGSWLMAIVLALTFPLPTRLSQKAWDRLNGTLAGLAEYSAGASALLLSVLTKLQAVQALPRGVEHFGALFDRATLAAARESTDAAYAAARGLAIVQLWYYGSRTVVFLAAGFFIKTGRMTLSAGLNSFLQLSAGSHFLTDCVGDWSGLRGARGACNRLLDLMAVPEVAETGPSGLQKLTLGDASKVETAIAFSNVRFSYPSNPDVSIFGGDSGLTLEISRSCQSAAIVGHTGSGKSTISSLLLRLYEPSYGHIRIGSHLLGDLDTRSLRRQIIACVPQSAVIFDGSVAFNVTLDANPPDTDAVWRALDQVGLGDLVRSFPRGLDEACSGASTSEGSAEPSRRSRAALSGGERQRLVFARILFLYFRETEAAPEILLLDEHSAALDPLSTEVLSRVIDDLPAATMRLLISHKVEDISRCAEVLVMDKGRLVDQGSFAELSSKGRVLEALRRSPSGDDDEVGRGQERLAEDRGASLADGNPPVITEARDAPGPKLAFFPWRQLAWMLKGRWTGLIALGLMGSLLEGAMVPIESFLLGSVVAALSQVPPRSSDTAFWALLFIPLGVLACAARFGVFFGYTALGTRFAAHLRRRLFRRLATLDAQSWGHRDPATVAFRVFSDPDTLRDCLVGLFNRALSVPLTVLSGFAVAFTLSWRLTLTLVACSPLLFLAGWAEMAGLAGFAGPMREAYEDANRLATEYLVKVKTIKLLGREEVFEALYDDRLRRAHALGIRRAVLAGAGTCLFQTLLIATLMVVFAVCFRLVVDGVIDFGRIVLVILSVILCSRQIGALLDAFKAVAGAKAAAIEVVSTLEERPAIDCTPDPAEDVPSGELASVEQGHAVGAPERTGLRRRRASAAQAPAAAQPDAHRGPVQGRITFSKVSFSYAGRGPALNAIDLEIPAGCFCAVVGKSGGGKSTLLSLLQRLWDPSSGTIAIDGIDLRRWHVHDLRSQIGVAQQSPALFDGSIGYNVELGMRPGGLEVAEALSVACLAEVVDELPQGLDTPVGELGTSKVSGGQAARIGIARAVVGRPRILILDEPTASLDAATAERLVDNVRGLARREGMTVVMVSHSFAAVRRADMVVLLDGGRVAESGPVAELLDRGGMFASMFARS
ncbi:P-loop containing nucleoside triphosphate hydrolase protein [Hyaloraphidium curvatum]|nr:P-loop containing nucleoside triphosphate hydrolase protein [Hyaloraphidium curvatum]